MDIRATTDEIHRKLDKLGLSVRFNYGGTFHAGGTISYNTHMHLETPHFSYDVVTTDRAVIALWIICGGKLRYKR